MSIANKLTIICLIIAASLGYSLYHKKSLDGYFKESQAPILSRIPAELQLKDFNSKADLNLTEVAKNSNGLLVHFWGTWCAPCEYELPEFLEYSKKLAAKNIKVVLLAVNDDDIKIKKYMKRFKDLPENIILIHDKNGLSMKKFGVVKVPETFVFDKAGKNVVKFVGPQDWKMNSYYTRVVNYLSL